MFLTNYLDTRALNMLNANLKIHENGLFDVNNHSCHYCRKSFPNKLESLQIKDSTFI